MSSIPHGLALSVNGVGMESGRRRPRRLRRMNRHHAFVLTLTVGCLASGCLTRSHSPAPPHGGETTRPAASALIAGETHISRDVSYVGASDLPAATATLDLYQRSAGSPQPLVVLVHGGSWVGGDKANFETRAPAFIPWWLDQGFTVAAVNFRLATPTGPRGGVSVSTQATDIAHALAWLHGHAADYGIADQGPILLGYSSGAHLVALLGADTRYVVNAGLPEDHIAATVSLDVHAYDVPFALTLMPGSVVERNIPKIERLFGATVEEQFLASPIAYIDDYVAPAMLVSVGDRPDQPGTHGYIVRQTSERYARALREHGHHAVTVHDDDENHTTLATGFGAPDDAITRHVEAFLASLP